MDFKQVETFLCVFEEGSVTRAAAKLHIVQPAVSNQLKKLEATLNLELFERLPRGISPTPSGRALYRLFAPVLESFRIAVYQAQMLSGAQIQEISVGINPFAGNAIMSDVLQTFRIRFPEVGVHVEEDVSTVLLHQVADGRLDLAIVHFGAQSIGIPATVVATVLAEEELVFVEKHPGNRSSREPMYFTDLANRPLVLIKSKLGFRRDLEFAAAQCGTPINIELEINAPGPLLDLVSHGDLATVMPEITARMAAQRLPLYIRRIVHPSVIRSVLAVHRKDRPLSQFLVQFVEIVKANCQSLLGRCPESAAIEHSRKSAEACVKG
jgi:DNA-binding transcriptional LysR family regulator